MRRKGFFVLRAILFGAFFVAAFGWAVMYLWNSLVPDLFHGPVISYLQAVGLIILGRLLFGGHRSFHPGWRHEMWRSRLSERWESMNPEEREKLRKELRRCGPGRFFHNAKENEVTDPGPA